MALITILPLEIKDWQDSGSFELRVYADDSFFTASGKKIPAFGKDKTTAFRRFSCTYNQTDKILTVPEVTLEATTDSPDNSHVRYREAAIYKIKGARPVYEILEDFRVPHDLASTLTWLEIQEASYSRRQYLGDGYYNVQQVNALVARLFSLLGIITPTNEYPFAGPFAVRVDAPGTGDVIFGANYHYLTAAVENNGSPNEIVEVEYFINSVSIGTGGAANFDYRKAFDTTAYIDGIYALRARAKDDADNLYWSEPVYFFIKNTPDEEYQIVPDFKVDLTQPSIGEVIISPDYHYLCSSVENLTGTENEIVEVEYFLNSVSIGTGGAANFDYRKAFDTTNIEDGMWALSARAKDDAGNYYWSEKVYVFIGDSPLGDYQPLDDSLTQIAALTPGNKDFLEFLNGAWTNRTETQVKTTLVLNLVDNTPDAQKPVSVAQAAADTAARDAAIAAIRNGVATAGNDLNKLYGYINALVAIVGSGMSDADSIVNTLSELLTVFSTFPEGVDVITLLNTKITGNAAIAPGTNTKITYDAKGLITGATQATTADISEAVGNLYFTAARALATTLSGIVFTDATSVTAANSILVAIGKLQAQITAVANAGTSLPTGDLNATTNKLEKIQNRLLNIDQPVAGFGDSFNTAGAFDSTKWVRGTLQNPLAAIVYSGGKLRFQYNGISQNEYLRTATAKSFADGDYIIVDVTALFGSIGSYTAATLDIGLSQNSNTSQPVALAYFTSANGIQYGHLTNSVGAWTHNLIRFIRSGTDLLVQWSDTGASWTTFKTHGNFSTFTNLYLYLGAGSSNSGSGTGEVSVESVTTSFGASDALTDKSLLWYNVANTRFENVTLAAIKTALAIPANIADDGTDITFNDKTISRFAAKLNDQTGTTYTLNATDNGKILTFSNASAITVTIPSTLIAGFNCTIYQKGAGQITFTVGSGAILRNPNPTAKTRAQYSTVMLFSPVAGELVLSGDIAQS